MGTGTIKERARRAIKKRDHAHGRGERVRVAEELGEAMDDRVHVVAERDGGDGIVAVADEAGRRFGVVEEFLEDGAVKGELHAFIAWESH